MARRIEVQIVGDSRSLERAFRRGGLAGSGFGRTIGRVAKYGTVALAGGLFASAKAAIDFESSFAGVTKTVDGTPKQLERISDGIRDMANEIPAGVNELNAIAESAGQLGVRRGAILDFTRTIADLGETTNLVGEEGAASLARFANITQMRQGDFDELGSTIVALGNAGASTEQEIADMALRLAGAGEQVGMTEADILGIANALSSVGIEAQAGGSAVSRVMVEIEKAVRGGGEEVEGFAKVAGESADDFSRHWERDPTDALITFVEGLAEISDEGKNVFGVLDKLGLNELRVRDALLRAAGAGDLLRESVELGSEAWAENSALGEEAAKRYETVASQLGVLKNNVVDIGISIGEAILPHISDAAGAFTDFLQDVRKADGTEAKIEVVLAGLEHLREEFADILFGSTTSEPIEVQPGKFVLESRTTEGLVTQISDAIVAGVEAIDWAEVAKRAAAGTAKAGVEIGKGVAKGIGAGVNAEMDEDLPGPLQKGGSWDVAARNVARDISGTIGAGLGRVWEEVREGPADTEPFFGAFKTESAQAATFSIAQATASSNGWVNQLGRVPPVAAAAFGKTAGSAARSASVAAQSVDGLQGTIDGLRGRTVDVGVRVFGTQEVWNLTTAIANVQDRTVSITALTQAYGAGRAAGGRVAPGVAYTVGEVGRELFVPDTPGTIVPNHKLGSIEGMRIAGTLDLETGQLDGRIIGLSRDQRRRTRQLERMGGR